MKMRKVTLLALMLSVLIGGAFAQTNYQTISATYSAGDIQTDLAFQNLGDNSICPGLLNVAVPANSIITSVDVEYTMTSALGAAMAEQRSQLRCVSPGGTSELEIYNNSDWSEGTWAYNRTGLDIANGVTPFIFGVDFELHAGRSMDGAGCGTDFQKVDDGSWTITVTYLVAGSPSFPTNPTPVDMATLVDIDTDLSWDFGANTTSYDVYFGTNNPPLTKVVDDASTAGGTGSYDPGTVLNATTYYWYVIGRNSLNIRNTPNLLLKESKKLMK